MILWLLLNFLCPQQEATGVIQSVQRGDQTAALVQAAPGVVVPTASEVTTIADSPSSLSTTVQDPSHPDEPIVVTTYQKRGESHYRLVQRHRELVAAVRNSLNDY